MFNLILACAAFVGTHFLLSHPLRATLVARMGERGFLGLYSLISFITLGWMVVAYRAVPMQPYYWHVGTALWALATLIMLVASILLVGSLIGNPALPDPTPKTTSRPPAPRGVFAVTRHPMLWSFALWSLAHILVLPIASNIVLALAIAILSLVGAALQDRKKERLEPRFWERWEGVTSFWPFVALREGRAQWAAAWPGTGVTLGGIALWLIASWAHMPLAGWPAGIWRWIG
ncbi:NnrU family protein [Stakelama sediminis]|uniref:Putative membrane protein n=1 Tax=Stakelama sediminis TaxID=463200 RepID=A0A840YWF8_9SPHN|nr:NnrU family protein [Stakelama sediminis]MBB5718061.1 putative membrane protein [Stakelama sediminis]